MGEMLMQLLYKKYDVFSNDHNLKIIIYAMLFPKIGSKSPQIFITFSDTY